MKPEFFADEEVNGLPVPARYLTLGLITRADDRGRQRRQDAAIAAHVFPEGDVTTKQVTVLLELIVGTGIALAYVVGGHGYLWLPNFWKHQRINRASESDLPSHPDDPLGALGIKDAMKKFKESSDIDHPQFTESSRTTHHSPAVPIPSLPIHGVLQGLTRERVTGVCAILAAIDWDVDEVGVENAIATDPDGDLERAAHLAVSWASDSTWTMGAASTFRSALRKLTSEKPASSAKARRGAALKGLMASTTEAAI